MFSPKILTLVSRLPSFNVSREPLEGGAMCGLPDDPRVTLVVFLSLLNKCGANLAATRRPSCHIYRQREMSEESGLSASAAAFYPPVAAPADQIVDESGEQNCDSLDDQVSASK